jgi:hypothetical protein
LWEDRFKASKLFWAGLSAKLRAARLQRRPTTKTGTWPVAGLGVRRSGMATVLIVDDEFAIADVLDAVFADEGYEMLTASSGHHGL